MRLSPEERKKAKAEHRQFNFAKVLFYNQLLNPDQLPMMPQWRQSNSFKADEVAAVVAPFEQYLKRTFNMVPLMVCIGDTEVCFNCLNPFTSVDARGVATWHHLLPWRFRGLPFYNTQVPVVKVHRNCTDGWHKAYDPGYHWKEDAAIWCAEEYIEVACNAQFGFGMYANPRRQHHPRLRVSRGLLPFLLGATTISYSQPKKPGQLVQLGDRGEIANALGIPSLASLPPQTVMPQWYVAAAA